MKQFEITSYNKDTNLAIHRSESDSEDVCKTWAKNAMTHYLKNGFYEDEIYFEIHHTIGELAFSRGEIIMGKFVWSKIKVVFNIMRKIENVINRQKQAA